MPQRGAKKSDAPAGPTNNTRRSRRNPEEMKGLLLSTFIAASLSLMYDVV